MNFHITVTIIDTTPRGAIGSGKRMTQIEDVVEGASVVEAFEVFSSRHNITRDQQLQTVHVFNRG